MTTNSTTSGASAFAVGFLAGMVTLGMARTILWQRQRQQPPQDQSKQASLSSASLSSSSLSSSSLSSSLPPPRRFGGAIQLLPEQYDLYTQLHDAVWDQVLERMSRSNIRNFTIYYHEETNTLFQHFEWIGHWYLPSTNDTLVVAVEEATQFQHDMDAIANDPIVLKWWSYCEPCQQPFSQWRRTKVNDNKYHAAAAADDDDDHHHHHDPLVPPPPPPSQGGQGGDWWAPLKCLTHCGHWAIQYSPLLRDPAWVPQNPHGMTSTASDPPITSSNNNAATR
jgi:L-rhamnose mutarotase